MSDLRDLYQDVILDHSKHPRNRRRIDGAREARGHNPLCGDMVTVYLVVRDDEVVDVAFEGSGCAISTAAASLMTQALRGRRRADVERLFERYHDVVTGTADPARGVEDLGKLAAFAGVSEFPVRVKCATLVWHTLKAALDQKVETVSTE